VTRFPAGLAALILVGSASAGAPLAADDRELLRAGGAKPLVFVLLDNSASMTLDPAGGWLPAGGDDPRSRIYQAKRALFEVFREMQGLHVGFATLNQDRLRVLQKHWLYRVAVGSDTLSINYPAPGDEITIGEPFETPARGVAGSCILPLDLDSERATLSRFPKLGPRGDEVTTHWLETGGRVFQLEIAQASPASDPGTPALTLRLTLRPVLACDPLQLGSPQLAIVRVALVTPLLVRDRADSASPEPSAGSWRWSDAVSETSCAPGSGWEGNYDSGGESGDPRFDAALTDVDAFCSAGDLAGCRSLLRPTKWSASSRAFDRGDMLPFDWARDQLDALLDRLAPGHGQLEPRELRVAPLFSDRPPPGGDSLELLDSARKPILAAAGRTPIGRALLDFACWYAGPEGRTCGAEGGAIPWAEAVADEAADWACRRTDLVVIGDGDTDCSEAEPCAAIRALRDPTGVATWILRLSTAPSSALDCAAAEDAISVADGDQLTAALRRILEPIREEARPELLAKAPPLETATRDVSFVASFEPLTGTAHWRGRLEAFERPVPRRADGRPDPASARLLWDAGTALLAQAPTLEEAQSGVLRLGAGASERRVFYSRSTDDFGEPTRAGGWPAARRLLGWTDEATGDAVRQDLWEGLGLAFDPHTEALANRILSATLALKQTPGESGQASPYLLGDIFHSRPLVLAAPAEAGLFLADVGGDGSPCNQGNPGYRCFTERHRYRRRIVAAGANDGMLHLFDAGLADDAPAGGVRYGPGAGRELAAYIPRELLPSLRRRVEQPAHRYGVDADAVAADVFIDPSFRGAPNPDDREFRTVLFAGLRDGGHGYVALDVTQPDALDGNGRPRPMPGDVPSCLGSTRELDPVSPAGCGAVPWPSPLWEFSDRHYDPGLRRWVPFDEDGNGSPDLAATWSPIGVGRIRLCGASDCGPGGTEATDHWVAVFGGGMDAEGRSGNWIYMVDIETGSTLYKRSVIGAVAAGIAAIDADRDGYLDRLYAATLAGLVYRVDLTSSSGLVPRLVEQRVAALASSTAGEPIEYRVLRIPARGPGGLPQWEPRIVFDAGDETAGAEPRSIFHRPGVILVASLGRHALAFGTGDRGDLWSPSSQPERFFVLLDDGDALEGTPPLRSGDLVEISRHDDLAGINLLTHPPVGKRGWFLSLDPDERLVSSPTTLSGLTAFTTFVPEVDVSETAPSRCTKAGESRLYALNATNGGGLLASSHSVGGLYQRISGLASPPRLEARLPPPADAPGGDAIPQEPPLSESQRAMMDRLRDLQPADCRFASYRIDLEVSAAQGRLVAPIPVCLIQKAWREF
jgi:hypothetical protein